MTIQIFSDEGEKSGISPAISAMYLAGWNGFSPWIFRAATEAHFNQ